jgi:hypothetical protein
MLVIIGQEDILIKIYTLLHSASEQYKVPFSLHLLSPKVTMATITLTDNIVPCGGIDNVDDGCQEVFPRGDSGLCSKCRKLAAPDLSEVDRENILKVLLPFLCKQYL